MIDSAMPRMRPSLIIIGAQKAGTTTLFDLLAQHPNIVAPATKEISFFSNDAAYDAGMPGYWSQFPHRPFSPKRYITFEASPMYLFHDHCAQRIAQHLPAALCMAVLRDPVDRAYSAWNMYHRFKDHTRHGHLYDPRTFTSAVADELAGKPEIPARRYLERGLYMPQLERYVAAMGRDRLLVRSFDKLTNDLHGLVADLLMRLGLEPMPTDHPAFGVRSNTRAYDSPIPAALAADLRAFFADDQEQVRSVFGQELDLAPRSNS